MLKAIRQSLKRPDAADSGIHQKNATPQEAPADFTAVIESVQPSILQPDRDNRLIETKGNREILALDKIIDACGQN